MPNCYPYYQNTNLVGIATACLANPHFNLYPKPLHIAGAREAASSLFACLSKHTCLEDCGILFQAYMCDVFGFEDEQRRASDAHGRRRFRNSYLSLIQDWGLDSNNAQGAVLKGWVESRFGLAPNYHKQPLAGFMNKEWIVYIEEKMHSRYHNNCIYMQLDLLYEFCQWVIERFRFPAATHKTLYRGVNNLGEVREQDNHSVVRFNSVVSFTDRRSIASEFGAYILETEVPMVKLVFFNDLLPHHALHGEAEYLVIGGEYRVKVSR
ncbi:MAG: NAD(+)--dinitrogen-reductase ADP-D-ribosyltransferase [Methylomonas sp.]|jgi:NAD+--dinitrogen-reductase ADP-D-ribosyltransferase